MKVRISRNAMNDLRAIWKFIATSSGSEKVATEADDKIYRAIKQLGKFPTMGHRRPDLRADRFRFWKVYSYLIVYRVEKSVLIVARVVHGSQNLRKIFPGNP